MDARFAMKVPRYRWFLWAAALAAAVFFLLQMGYLSRGHATTAPRGFELLDTLMSHIRNDYLEERDPLLTAEGTFRGLVNSLDPLSAYLSKDLVEGYQALPDRQFEPGLVVLKRYAAFPQVVAVFDKSPAQTAGVRLGDLISAIGGRNTLSMSLTEVKILLRGTDAGPVDIRILRGNDTHNVTVARARLFPAPYTLIRTAGQPARLRIHRFDDGLAAAVKRELAAAFKTRPVPLVLDLRDCQDGTIAEAARLVNLFVKAADAGRFEGRDGAKEPVSCPAEPAFGAVPLVVWTGAGTAGPAEVAAGLLQEVRQAKIAGFETAGLAGRTTLFPLKDDSAVLLTSGIFHLPSGRKIWEDGLVPDAAIPIDKLNDKTYLEKTPPLWPKR
ncbi:MAG TPA: S41 family peptidase [Candidatus Aminicenantes bacterium]|nr:S41 family peptidase [Candidatus Aminicenantes bacterium]HRY66145.1 S41 family peptidase [Candidatus Aminicenantes bacterium]HRZ73059.1 S41 family peptidase [Candidatus Aminicenantes bacterium]